MLRTLDCGGSVAVLEVVGSGGMSVFRLTKGMKIVIKGSHYRSGKEGRMINMRVFARMSFPWFKLSKKNEGLPPDTLENTAPAIGYFGPRTGIGQWVDNHGNKLGADNLHCSDEALPRDLNFSDAVRLHITVENAQPNAFSFSKTELGEIESPLHTFCKDEKHQQKR